MREREKRYEVSELTLIKLRLQDLGAELLWAGIEENSFFDTKGKSFQSTGKVLRLRLWPDRDVTLTVKGPKKRMLSGGKEAEEHTLIAQSEEEARRFLELLECYEVERYSKRREHWSYRGLFVELDRLGRRCFVEIEGPDEASIDQLARLLGVPHSALTSESYRAIAREQRGT